MTTFISIVLYGAAVFSGFMFEGDISEKSRRHQVIDGQWAIFSAFAFSCAVTLQVWG